MLAQRLAGKQANSCACPLLSLGCSADGWWRLLWLCHATNKEGRIFQLGLVTGAVAPWCRQPMSVLGALGAVCLSPGLGPHPAPRWRVPSRRRSCKPQPRGAVSPGWALRAGFMCFPKSCIRGRCSPVEFSAQSALDSCWQWGAKLSPELFLLRIPVFGLRAKVVGTQNDLYPLPRGAAGVLRASSFLGCTSSVTWAP